MADIATTRKGPGSMSAKRCNYISPMTVAAFKDLGYGLVGTNYAQYADAGNILLG